ncbi:MAG: hypothetical protein ABL308_01490 [Oceanicaulis sp.]
MRDDPLRDALYAPPEDGAQHQLNRIWLANSALLALVLLTATNAESIERWAASKPPNWGTETVRLTAGVLADRMAMIGLDEPRREMTRTWENWRETDWEEL